MHKTLYTQHEILIDDFFLGEYLLRGHQEIHQLKSLKAGQPEMKFSIQ